MAYGYYPTQNYFPQMNNAVPDMLNSYKAQYQPQNGFLWVQGEQAAKAYLVAPNSTAVLWDSEKQLIYIKSADASGMPSIRTIEWKDYVPPTETPTEHVCSCGDKFVSKEDFTALQGDVERLTKRIDAMVKPKSKIMKHSEEDFDEQLSL